MNDVQKRVVIYARVSSEEQIEGTSIDGQLEYGHQFAKAKGWTVVAECEDPGVSGTRYHTRPGIIKAIKLIEQKKADAIIATKIDRIGRSVKVISDIIERVRACGGDFITGDFTFDDT